MIVCQCRGITDADIRAAAAVIRAGDPGASVSPARVYRALGTAPDCAGCLPLFVATLREDGTLIGSAAPRGVRAAAGQPKGETRCKATKRSLVI